MDSKATTKSNQSNTGTEEAVPPESGRGGGDGEWRLERLPEAERFFSATRRGRGAASSLVAAAAVSLGVL